LSLLAASALLLRRETATLATDDQGAYMAWMLFNLTRRAALAGGALLAAPAQAQARKVVTLLGDSITAGFGLPSQYALPARLQAELDAMKVSAVVRGAGVSGDTTAGGLGRVDFSVRKDTTVCVVALGGNDLLRGLPPSQMKANLDAIVRKLKARRIKVVLAGIVAPPIVAELVGAAYVREFNAVFPAVAAQHKVPLLPNLLEGVATNARLNQGDGIHPNEEGVKLIARRLAGLVSRSLRD